MSEGRCRSTRRGSCGCCWRRGPRPDVRRLLDRAGDLAPAQVAAALRVDQRERWRIGDRVPAADYLRDCPALRGDPEAALEMIYGELLLREELGEAPHRRSTCGPTRSTPSR